MTPDTVTDTPPVDTPLDFPAGMDRAALLIPFLMQIPAAELHNYITRAHTIGPILDPTAYQRGMGNLEQSQAVVSAVLAFQREIHKCPELVARLRERGGLGAG